MFLEYQVVTISTEKFDSIEVFFCNELKQINEREKKNHNKSKSFTTVENYSTKPLRSLEFSDRKKELWLHQRTNQSKSIKCAEIEFIQAKANDDDDSEYKNRRI